jgi:hypothetical protein
MQGIRKVLISIRVPDDRRASDTAKNAWAGAELHRRARRRRGYRKKRVGRRAYQSGIPRYARDDGMNQSAGHPERKFLENAVGIPARSFLRPEHSDVVIRSSETCAGCFASAVEPGCDEKACRKTAGADSFREAATPAAARC